MDDSHMPDRPAADATSSMEPQRSPGKSVVSAVLNCAIYVYLIGTMISAPYFNWCYARDNGFVSWLFFGEIVATAQAAIWPVYAFSNDTKPDWTDEERENIKHFERMSDAMQQSTRIVNSGRSGKASVMPPEDARAIASLHALALKEANLVDPAVLAKAHPDLPAHFQSDLLPFLQTMNRVHAGRASLADQLEAHTLFDKWVDWFNANRTDIKIPK
jgi:hypothetical protein